MDCRRCLLLLALALLPSTTTFAQAKDDTRPKGGQYSRNCSAAAAHSLIGEKLNADTKALALARSGATSVRVVKMNGPRDLGMVSQRLTLAVDWQQLITELWCG
ncbi:I78 family peptidase inhibitor [Pseudomonas xanthosomatis]|uniref:I78 family peptidase inhibitor n=1 Tax=Pseudomonas xanthosomatis TaxID=2842356 RepID=UPI0035188187